MKRSEFDFLNHVRKTGINTQTQRELSQELGFSLGKVNALKKDLISRGMLEGSDGGLRLTEEGLKALEPYKVENAVIMAAGMSTRFAPLSYEKPKGLLNVKGEVLIEREIRQLHEAGINDITVVCGYMKEKFFYLEDKFGVKIVINEDYYQYNNTSTLIRVLDRLSNTYICSSDNYFVDNVFEPYVYQGYYAAVYTEGKTDEYCLETDGKGRIKNVTIGGADSWYMLGHVYFDRAFSGKFVQILKKEYENAVTREQLWENLYIRYINELDLYIRKYDADKVLEFDSLDELRLFDEEYINNADSSIMRNICNVLKCEIKDISGIEAIKAGLTNTSFKFRCNGKEYVYRHPGKDTEKFINRSSEAYSMQKARELGLDSTFIYMDSKEGWKVSEYISDVRELDYRNEKQVDLALALIRKLHDADLVSEFDFDIWARTLDFTKKLKSEGRDDFEGYDELLSTMRQVMDLLKSDGYAKKHLCHNDCYSPNFLLDKDDNMYLIDWEYSGNDDPASDLGTFICCSDYSFEEAEAVLKKYLKDDAEPGLLRHYTGYVAVCSYYWFIWALFQESRGNHVGEWLYLWHRNARQFASRFLKM